jgi:hypothetical protein
MQSSQTAQTTCAASTAATVHDGCVLHHSRFAPWQAGSLVATYQAVVVHDCTTVLLCVQAYHGGLQHVRDPSARASRVHKVIDKAAAAVDAISKRAGLQCQVVTGGGSGTYRVEAASGVFTEVQPGAHEASSSVSYPPISCCHVACGHTLHTPQYMRGCSSLQTSGMGLRRR